MAQAVLFWLSFAIFLYFVFYACTTFGLIGRSLYETAHTAVARGRLFTPPIANTGRGSACSLLPTTWRR